MHSKLPWNVVRDIVITDADNIGVTEVYGDYTNEIDNDNAAFIVKCVNLHNELVESLKELVAFVQETVDKEEVDNLLQSARVAIQRNEDI